MTLIQHVAWTGAAVAALSPIFTPGEALLFAVGGVLIDVDHYFLYIQRRRDFSVSGMFRYFSELQPLQRAIPYVGLCVFHTIDFFILLALLWHLYPPVGALLAGCLFHFVLDLIHLRRQKVIFIRPYLLVEHFIRRRAKGYPWY